jgi:DNA-binding transcriptional LysR family regulator
MHMFNIRSVDLNLLPVFEAVYEEQNLSRAAVRLAMTQSAVSHALTRLRALFSDELFVRRSRGVAPTQRARTLCKAARRVGSMRETVAERRGFVARTSKRRYFLAIAHPLGPMIVLRLLERLATVAPNIGRAASTRSRPIELDRALRDGQIDAAIDWIEPEGDQFKSTVLFDDVLVAVAREGTRRCVDRDR